MSGFKMPEPNGALYEYKSRQGKPFVYYTADQIRQSVIDSLEMAAQLCDNKKGTLGAKYQGDVYAEAIRALKEQIV